MPILALGNPDVLQACGAGCMLQRRRRSRIKQAGFTLLELLVVLAIVAFASAGVGFALRDGTQTRLEREALRLGALLDAARARAQVSGVPVRWRASPQGFRFEPEPVVSEDPQREWLDPDTRAQVNPPPNTAPTDAVRLLLGPDAIIAPQSVTLSSASQPQQRLVLGTDGVRPFTIQVQP